MFRLKTSRRAIIWSMAALLMGTSTAIYAADPLNNTTITIKGLHCAGCAKKVKSKLTAVANVKSAEVDHQSGLATVKVVESKSASPRALWEAVESADAKPTKLVGPDGTFTSKPNT